MGFTPNCYELVSDFVTGNFVIGRFKNKPPNYKITRLQNQKRETATLPLPQKSAQLCSAGRRGRLSLRKHLYAALPAPFTSSVFWLPTFTLTCFGLASAFLARRMFSTPLS